MITDVFQDYSTYAEPPSRSGLVSSSFFSAVNVKCLDTLVCSTNYDYFFIQ